MLRRTLAYDSGPCFAFKARHHSFISGSSLRFFTPKQQTATAEEHAAIQASMASQPVIDLEQEFATMAAQPYQLSDLSPSLVELLGVTFATGDVWTQARMQIAKDRKLLSAAQIYSILENARASTQLPRPHSDTLDVMIMELGMKRDWTEAVDWWDRLREEGSLTLLGVEWGGYSIGVDWPNQRSPRSL